MDIPALRVFATVAREGSLPRAAERLHTQVRGTLSIGTILDPEFTRRGAFLRQLVESAPQVETVLRQGMSGEVLARVEAGELDVGYYLGDPNEGRVAPAFRVHPLTPFTYRVLAPAGWGPQVQGQDWRALASLPWIETPAASAHHRLLHKVLAPQGLRVRRVAQVDQEASMLDLVRSGVGLSLVRDSVAIREAQARGLVIADRVQLDCVLSFICLAGREQEPAIQAAWVALEGVWG